MEPFLLNHAVSKRIAFQNTALFRNICWEARTAGFERRAAAFLAQAELALCLARGPFAADALCASGPCSGQARPWVG